MKPINIICTIFVLLVSCCEKKLTDGLKYKTYQEACRAYDFEAAHLFLDELEAKKNQVSYISNVTECVELKEYNAAFDYIFNAEALFLSAQGDAQSIDRIVFLLSGISINGTALPEGAIYHSGDYIYEHTDDPNAYTENVIRFNNKCNMLVDLGISVRNLHLIERVIPLYKPVPDKIISYVSGGGEERNTHIMHYSNTEKENAKSKVINAVNNGVFGEVANDELLLIQGL